MSKWILGFISKSLDSVQGEVSYVSICSNKSCLTLSPEELWLPNQISLRQTHVKGFTVKQRLYRNLMCPICLLSWAVISPWQLRLWEGTVCQKRVLGPICKLNRGILKKVLVDRDIGDPSWHVFKLCSIFSRDRVLPTSKKMLYSVGIWGHVTDERWKLTYLWLSQEFKILIGIWNFDQMCL